MLVGNDADLHPLCARFAGPESSFFHQLAAEALASEIRMHGQLLESADVVTRLSDADTAADTIGGERQQKIRPEAKTAFDIFASDERRMSGTISAVEKEASGDVGKGLRDQ